MTPLFRFDGIYTPVITPYHADGTVNHDALGAVIEHLIASGVHGIITGGSTGENYAQTVAERVELARLTHDMIRGRVPLVMGTGAMLTSDSIALAQAGREIGAQLDHYILVFAVAGVEGQSQLVGHGSCLL